MWWLAVPDFYSNLAKSASKLIRAKGQEVSFTRVVPDVFDESAGKVEYKNDITFTGYGVLLPYDVLFTVSAKGGKTKLLYEAIGTKPLDGDRVIVNGVAFVVEEVKELAPAGIVVIYELLLRN